MGTRQVEPLSPALTKDIARTELEHVRSFGRARRKKTGENECSSSAVAGSLNRGRFKVALAGFEAREEKKKRGGGKARYTDDVFDEMALAMEEQFAPVQATPIDKSEHTLRDRLSKRSTY